MRQILVTVASLSPTYGGPVTKARGLAEGLRALGYQVTVMGVGQAPWATGIPAVGRFHSTPIPAALRPVLRAVQASDVVHVMGYRDPVGIIAALAARRRSIPYLMEPSGMHRRRLRSLTLKLAFDRLIGSSMIDHAACVVATSRLEAEDLKQDGIPETKIKVRPNGIELQLQTLKPKRGSLRLRLGIPIDAPLILSVGRIAANKGLVEFARALAACPGTLGLVAGPDEGDGTLGELLKERTRLALTDRLFVHPAGLWNGDKASAFADADAFCLPSPTESFGNAAAEAAAAGLPVIVSDRCGVVDWLEPDAVRVVPYGDVHLLAKAMRDASERSCRAAARKAAPRIRRELDWRVIAARQAEIYADLS